MEWATFIIISELQWIPRFFESTQIADTRYLYVINIFFSSLFHNCKLSADQDP